MKIKLLLDEYTLVYNFKFSYLHMYVYNVSVVAHILLFNLWVKAAALWNILVFPEEFVRKQNTIIEYRVNTKGNISAYPQPCLGIYAAGNITPG